MKSTLCTLGMVILAATCLILVGCEKKTEEAQQAPEVKTEKKEAKANEAKPGEKTPVAAKTVELTDDLWIEVKVHEMVAAGIFSTQEEQKKMGPEGMSKAVDEVYKKYGVTKSSLNDYLDKVTKMDPSRGAKLTMTAFKKAQELKKAK